jgi:thymidylate kinase
VEKKDVEFTNKFVKRQMRSIKKALWDYPKTCDLRLLGDHHWLNLIVAWYCALDKCIIRPDLDQGEWIICDSWVHKYVARFTLKPGFREQTLRGYFSSLTNPDLIFFLDVPPRLSVLRRPAFTPTEMGRFDGEDGEPQASYISYQSRIGVMYRRWAREHGWVHLKLANEPADQVIQQVIVTVQDRLLQSRAGQSR